MDHRCKSEDKEVVAGRGVVREGWHSRLRDTTDTQNTTIAAKHCKILLRLKFYCAVFAEQPSLFP